MGQPGLPHMDVPTKTEHQGPRVALERALRRPATGNQVEVSGHAH